MTETNAVTLAIEFLQRCATRENGFTPIFISALKVVIEQAERAQ